MADLMFPNMFSSIMVLKKRVTSTLQTMKQWNLFNGYHWFLMCFQPYSGWEEGRSLKRFPALFPQHFWLLVLIFFPHSCKISGPYLVIVSSYWIWTKTNPQKKSVFLVKSVWNFGYDNFSHKDAKLTKIWSHDHIYYIIWATW